MAKRVNTITDLGINVANLSPAQVASGAHNGITPTPYKLIHKVFSEGYLDDHRGWFDAVDSSIHKPSVVILRTDLYSGMAEVCYADDDVRGFSVNPFYVDESDNMVHLSVWSVGCTVKKIGKSLEEAVDDANKETFTYSHST